MREKNRTAAVERNSFDFDAVIDHQGRITVPSTVLEGLIRGRTGKVHVRLSNPQHSLELKRRGVTEEEVERVAAMQMEQREQVVKFFMSEGALRENARWRGRATGKKRDS